MPWLFFLKASAEVESADHLYPVEDGFRKQYADFGGESKATKRLRVNKSKSVGVGLLYRYRYRLQASSMSPHRSSSPFLYGAPENLGFLGRGPRGPQRRFARMRVQNYYKKRMIERFSLYPNLPFPEFV